MKLIEGSIVATPAYPSTTAQLRSLFPDGVPDEVAKHQTRSKDDACTCPCTECMDGNCDDCSDPDCNCEGCDCDPDDLDEDRSNFITEEERQVLHLCPIILAALSFRSKTEYCWTGIGRILYDGNTYIGVGAFGKEGTVTEATAIQADGTTVSLSGVNPDLYAECLADIQQGLPAKLYVGVLSYTGKIVIQPYLFFSGYVDKSSVSVSPESLTITLNLKKLMSELQRPPMLRCISADQALLFATDSAFDWVEQLKDQALRRGN